jgi:hypothetical protein
MPKEAIAQAQMLTGEIKLGMESVVGSLDGNLDAMHLDVQWPVGQLVEPQRQPEKANKGALWIRSMKVLFLSHKRTEARGGHSDMLTRQEIKRTDEQTFVAAVRARRKALDNRDRCLLGPQ